jgi:hypothetical protein
LSKRRPLDRHHLTPRSRLSKDVDPDKDNVVYWDRRFHARYHALFNNMKLSEIILFLQTISKPDEVWDNKRMHQLMQDIKDGKKWE